MAIYSSLEAERYRVAALDFGTKRIGIALSDELRILASARGIIPNSGAAKSVILKIVESENVRLILLGLPSTLSGGDSDMTRQVRAFASKLEPLLAKIGVQLELRDERLTSVLANYNIAQSDLPKYKREEKHLRDEEAARILLQEYLDQHR
jgi:putative Holliday junction resolvase